MLSVIMLNVVAPLLSGTLQGFAVLPETLDLAEKVCQGQKYFWPSVNNAHKKVLKHGCALLAQWSKYYLALLRARVQIPPLALGDQKWRKKGLKHWPQ
jgi:hypothetical protein